MEDSGVDALLILMMFASANRAAVSGFSDLLLKWKQQKPVVACLIAPPGFGMRRSVGSKKGVR